MLPVMQVGRVRPGAPPEHDVLHPVGGGLGQARPTNNIGMHGTQAVLVPRTSPPVVSASLHRAATLRNPSACAGPRIRARWCS
ncbi:MAG: hypothetical protein FJ404_18825 [Verrucomicrobia bacterium]|nr:hypothetical protein [Verrucomicrobiota bacterium]